MDPSNQFISKRLYREHCSISNCTLFKNIDLLGRDLASVIIVDNSPANFKSNTSNGIAIETWIENQNDNKLEELSLLLKNLACVEDVRKYIPILKKNNNDYFDLAQIIKNEISKGKIVDNFPIKGIKNVDSKIECFNKRYFN